MREHQEAQARGSQWQQVSHIGRGPITTLDESYSLILLVTKTLEQGHNVMRAKKRMEAKLLAQCLALVSVY